MVNIPYHTARTQGRITRSLYKAALPQIVKIPIQQQRQIPVTVYALSCERDLPEQVASIRSFINYVGVPDRFIVISDGSYTENSCELLCRIHPCIEVVLIDKLIGTGLPRSVYDYAAINPMGKKLAVLLSIPYQQPTIYTDSDILFFPGAGELLDLVNLKESRSWYLPDCKNSLDPRVIYEPSEQINPINAGFIIFKQALDWNFALERLERLQEPPNFFTEQTLVHLTLRYHQALPLDSKQYVLSVDDQFIYPDKYASKQIALRHYVSDIRHKFWFHLGSL
ncbi:MAG: hypothetical protein KME17_10515 [Cyanosarcina radialis HA8281-LM2]|jgi:hypothetical protein|nr:hypothetical protein [Cyanosarcina radialis HA8281-LM2]